MNCATVSRAAKFSSEWPGVYVIVGMRWEYQRGHDINIEVASDDDIQRGYGSTDGWSAADLLPA